MIKIFTNPNAFLVANVQNLLSLQGIDVVLRNEFASGATGELSFVDVWPELWIEEWQKDRATEIIKSMENEASGVWSCCNCREENEASFESCWQCGQDRADW